MDARSASIASFVVLLLLLAVPSFSNHLKLDLRGSIYDKEFYATMKIGAKAQEYNLQVDTGSVLTWVQCRVPRAYCQGPCKTWRQPHRLYELIPQKVVGSMDPLCVEWLRQPGNPNEIGCNYEIHYPEDSSQGYLVRDMFTLRSTGHHTFAFGCGYNQVGEHAGQYHVDGVLALGRSGSSVALTSQLKQGGVITKNVISHCFRARGGGVLFIGETTHSSVGISWVAMDTNTENGHYSPAVEAALHFQGKPISNNLMKLVFDSGTTYTFFDKEPYQMALNAVKGSLHASLREVRDPPMDLCWKGPHNGFRDVYHAKPLFKTLALVFTLVDNRQSTLEIPPENYLMISPSGNVCFAILHNPGLGGINIIGAVTMLDRFVIYDNEAGRIGWARDPCRGT